MDRRNARVRHTAAGDLVSMTSTERPGRVRGSSKRAMVMSGTMCGVLRHLAFTVLVFASFAGRALAIDAPVPVAPCAYPSMAKPDSTLWRLHALRGYDYFTELVGNDVTEGCLPAWRRFLRDVAHSAMEAGKPSSKEGMLFREKELEVRLVFAGVLTASPLTGESRPQYRDNVTRIVDIYESYLDAPSLFDHLRYDPHFADELNALPKARGAIRRALYSCDNWNFTHPADLKHKYLAWNRCLEDFRQLGHEVPVLKVIAPRSFAFLARQAVITSPQVEPARDGMAHVYTESP